MGQLQDSSARGMPPAPIGGDPRSARLVYETYRTTIWLPRGCKIPYIAIRYEVVLLSAVLVQDFFSRSRKRGAERQTQVGIVKAERSPIHSAELFTQLRIFRAEAAAAISWR